MENIENPQEIKCISIDCGSGFTKAGISGELTPKYIFPTIIGTPKKKKSKTQTTATTATTESQISQKNPNFYIGDDALDTQNGSLEISYPIEYGMINDFDGLEKILHHTFYSVLKMAPEEHPVIMTETALNPKYKREKLIQIIFETFNVPAFYAGIQSILSLNSSGRTTGCVVDFGDGVTQISPIYEGYALPHAILKYDIGGREITEFLIKLLKKNENINKIEKEGFFENKKVMNDIKEKLGYVSIDYETEKEKKIENEEIYELPDGNKIKIGKERFECAELLFTPILIGNESDGVDKICSKSIMKCDVDIRNDLFENILFAGGSSMFDGLKERMLKELTKLNTKFKKINCVEKNGKYSAWVGESILSSLETFQQMWITKEEYDESGPSIRRSPCF